MKFHIARRPALQPLSCLSFGLVLSAVAAAQAPEPAPVTSLVPYARQPMAFEPNAGQMDPRVKFVARGIDYTLFLTGDEAVIERVRRGATAASAVEGGGEVLRLSLVGARRGAGLKGRDPEAGRAHYLIGNGPDRSPVSVARYARVEAPQVYPGIDLVYYGQQHQLEFDFLVAPRADPSRIRLRFGGARDLWVDGDGNLVVRMAGADLIQHRPYVYQLEGNSRIERQGRYVVHEGQEASIEIAAYDRDRELVIDPLLVYSIRPGGDAGDRASGVVVDDQGNAFIVGTTAALDFPALGESPSATASNDDVFVTKLDPAGRLVFISHFGGSGRDTGEAIAIDARGSAYVTGTTSSVDFPTVLPFQSRLAGVADAFVVKLAADGGSLAYSSYLGGRSSLFGPDTGRERAAGIAVDRDGNAYVTGDTNATDFPTVNASQTAFSGAGDPEAAFYDPSNAYVAKIAADGQRLLYSTYFDVDAARGFPGTGNEVTLAAGIVVDTQGRALIAGTSLFYNDGPASTLYVARFGALGSRPEIFRPPADSAIDGYVLGARALAQDPTGNVYVAGEINGEGVQFLAPTPGALQTDCAVDNFGGLGAFVTKLTPALDIAYTTYLCPPTRPDGDQAATSVGGIAVDRMGRAYITGSTDSAQLVTVGAVQPQLGGATDAFILGLDALGSKSTFSTYLGGAQADRGDAIAMDPVGHLYVVGSSASSDFPTTQAVAGPAPVASYPDAFAVRIDPGSTCHRGILGFVASETVVEESQGQATFAVARTAGSCGPASVGFDMSAGTAHSGIQYRRVRGVLGWTDGEEGPRTFAVPIFDDGLYDRRLGATAFLTAPGGAALGSATSALWIVNGDARPAVGLTTASQRRVRGPATLDVVAGLSAISGLDTRILFTFSGTAVSGRDFGFATGENGAPITSLVIPARQKTGHLRLIFPAAAAGTERKLVVTIRAVSGATPRDLLVNTFTIGAN